ncbi:hypothetical protein ACJ41P_26420 [Azospirillum argentinense]|uniref:Protein mom n=1 Tax=Azospirillum argentinense TaxID=2970906 RepID=A0ABW8VHP0_9PROT
MGRIVGEHPRLSSVGDRGYIFHEQDSRRVVGFGDAEFRVAEIPRSTAVDIIVRHHYSGRIVQNSYIHLGVFLRGELVGALQFGYAMNPASGKSVVAGTGNREYLELNRMWLSDEVPRNGESMAISYATKFIKAVYPSVQWIQSFADERCGCWGVVYQACNFVYCGFHLTNFYHLDGVWYHEMLLTAHKKGGTRGAFLRANLDRAARHRFRQFRYILFLKASARKRLLRKVFPYPKPGLEAAHG